MIFLLQYFYIIHNISFHSIEGERVNINAGNTDNCEVDITNVGPEDQGTWTFRTLYIDNDNPYKLQSHEHTVEVTVEEVTGI